jgi:hypothetical protein
MNYCQCEEPDKQYGELDEPYCKKCGCWIKEEAPNDN